jgi:8-oxo-dGTP diphosphatase
VLVVFFDDEPQPATVTQTAAARASATSFFTGQLRVLDYGTKTVMNPTPHAVIAVVLRVHEGRLEVLLASAARDGDALETALGRAVDVQSLAHVEQLETRVLDGGGLATAYLGLARATSALGATWRDLRQSDGRTRDEVELVAAAQARLRAKLSYTNVGFALAPLCFTLSELREIYIAALGHDVSATNLQRVLLRRGVLERVEGLRSPGRAGGRPAALFRFAAQQLEVTDEFAALRPPR